MAISRADCKVLQWRTNTLAGDIALLDITDPEQDAARMLMLEYAQNINMILQSLNDNIKV